MHWRYFALFGLLTAAPPAFAAAEKHPLPARVYVFTAHSTGAVDPDDEQGRLDSVRDVVDALRRRSEFLVVATAEEAQVRVEIVNREERDASQGGFGGQALTRFRETIVRLLVESGDDRAELKGVGRPSWKAAAKDAAERLSKWVKSHGVVGKPASDGPYQLNR